MFPCVVGPGARRVWLSATQYFLMVAVSAMNGLSGAGNGDWCQLSRCRGCCAADYEQDHGHRCYSEPAVSLVILIPATECWCLRTA